MNYSEDMMKTKSKTESTLGFKLTQDYNSLIYRTEESNKKLKNKPYFAAVIIVFITIALCSNGELSHKDRADFFYLGIGIALFSYVYFYYKHKLEIADNKLAIERWHKEFTLQDLYVAYLYELEEEFEKQNKINIAEKIVNSIASQKSSGVEKK